MRVLLCLVALVGLTAAGKPANCGQITCRCYDGKSMYPSYPTIKSCQIPNSDDWVASFVENDCTWHARHEFPAGPATNAGSAVDGQYWLTARGAVDSNGDCTSGPCMEVQSKPIAPTSGYFICKLMTPKCWNDPGRVENSVFIGKYDCVDVDEPRPAWNLDTCDIKCLGGFKISGGPTTCRGGKWVNFPRCDRAGCAGMPPKGPGMTGFKAPCAGNGPFASGTQCDPVCADGWELETDAVCKMKGGKPQWEAAVCNKKPPPNPPKPLPKRCPAPKWPMHHGKWTCKGNVLHGHTCGYSCGPGFKPAGQAPKCVNGKWDQQHPSTMKAKNKAHCACKPFQHIGPNTPPACVFGGYSGLDRVDFVADVSGSMNAGMKAGGKSYKRIDYLKIALRDAIDSLDSDQMFNIIKYSTDCKGWKRGVVKATDANKKAGDSWVNGFRASGGTNMHCGLVKAELDTKVDGIFLLTDGEPTIKMSGMWSGKPTKENRRDPYRTIRTVISSKKWNKKVVVNPISFFAPARRYKDLDWVAKKTNGKHHKIK